MSAEQIFALKNRLQISALLLQNYYFDSEALIKQFFYLGEAESLFGIERYRYCFCFNRVEGTGLDKKCFKQSVKNYRNAMSTKMMTYMIG